MRAEAALSLLADGETVPVSAVSGTTYNEAHSTRSLLRRYARDSGLRLCIVFDPSKSLICFKTESTEAVS